jgi:hypothetical protein
MRKSKASEVSEVTGNLKKKDKNTARFDERDIYAEYTLP